MPFDEFLLAINQFLTTMREIEAAIGLSNTHPPNNKPKPSWLFTNLLYINSLSSF